MQVVTHPPEPTVVVTRGRVYTIYKRKFTSMVCFNDMLLVGCEEYYDSIDGEYSCDSVLDGLFALQGL